MHTTQRCIKRTEHVIQWVLVRIFLPFLRCTLFVVYHIKGTEIIKLFNFVEHTAHVTRHILHITRILLEKEEDNSLVRKVRSEWASEQLSGGRERETERNETKLFILLLSRLSLNDYYNCSGKVFAICATVRTRNVPSVLSESMYTLWSSSRRLWCNVSGLQAKLHILLRL